MTASTRRKDDAMPINAHRGLVLIICIAAALLLSACVRRAELAAPVQPVATDAEGETEGPDRRETSKEYWARINATKQAAARTRALRDRLGMKNSAPAACMGPRAARGRWAHAC